MSVPTEAILRDRRFVRGFGRRRAAAVKARAAQQESDSLTFFVYLFLLHLPLGVLMYWASPVAIIHPLAVGALGLYRAIQKNERIERVAYVVAYLIGSEILWRMASAPLPWEFGKYAGVLIMIVALFRRGHINLPGLPLLYLLLLLPACVITYLDNDWEDARDRLSFNMSGPICLFVSCWFFSYLKLSGVQMKKLLLSIAVPLLSVAIATLFFTVTNPYLQFTNESNHLTSGGFGPNQVSAMLGLGAFVMTSLILLFRSDLKTTLFTGGLALLFAAQSVLTFSRGGIYAAMGALAAVGLLQARDSRQLIGRFLPLLAIVAIFMFLIFPNLNRFTGGKLEERFESSDTTNRLELLELELQVFFEHPFWGAGVGEAIDERYRMTRHFAPSHTEVTRLLSEHGTFGVFAILALIGTGINNLRKQKTRIGKAFVAGVLVWSGLFMMNAGMRLGAPSLLWGMSFVLIFGPPVRRTPRVGRVRAPRRLVPGIRDDEGDLPSESDSQESRDRSAGSDG